VADGPATPNAIIVAQHEVESDRTGRRRTVHTWSPLATITPVLPAPLPTHCPTPAGRHSTGSSRWGHGPPRCTGGVDQTVDQCAAGTAARWFLARGVGIWLRLPSRLRAGTTARSSEGSRVFQRSFSSVPERGTARRRRRNTSIPMDAMPALSQRMRFLGTTDAIPKLASGPSLEQATVRPSG
jgi:hypothetical protein